MVNPIVRHSLRLVIIFSLLFSTTVEPTLPLATTVAAAPADYLTTHFTYDPNGNLESRTDAAGNTTHYEYDDLNQLIAVRYPDGSAVTYSYDAAGQRIQMTDTLGTSSYEYDIHGRLASVTDPNGYTIRYEYDPRGLLTKLTYPDGSVASYTWDANGQLTTVTDSVAGETHYEYDLAGKLVKRILPNGVTTHYGYDPANRLQTIQHIGPKGDLLLGLAYVFDATGNRTQLTQTEANSPPQVTRYQYDALSRLVEVSYPDGEVVDYNYDAVGNRTRMTSSTAGVTHYTYNSLNQLLQLDGPQGRETFRYDPNGNLVERQTASGQIVHYKWDYENRLIGVNDEADVVSFGYDGDGRRMTKTINGQRTEYVQHGYLIPQVLQEGTDGQTIRSLLGLPHTGEVHAQSALFYLEDGLGSVVGVIDRKGEIVNTIRYDAFGVQRQSILTFSTRSGFVGEQFDAEIKLVFLRARFYDPMVGRFISEDPFPASTLNPQTLNPYIYVNNNPANLVDPLGLQAPKITPLSPNDPPPPFWSNSQELWQRQFHATSTLPRESRERTSEVKIRPIFEGQIKKDHAKVGIGTEGGYLAYKFNDYLSLGVRIGSTLSVGISTIGELGVDYDRHGFHFKGPISHSSSTTMDGITVETTRVSVSGLVSLAASFYLWRPISIPVKAGLEIERRSIPTFYTPTRPLFFEPSYVSLGQTIKNNIIDTTRGGITLNRIAEVLVDLTDITGAIFDPTTGQVVLIGRKESEDLSLPPMNMDDLVVAIQSVYTGENPGVTMVPRDPSMKDITQEVKYFGQTENTHFGQVMFEADRYLKGLAAGQDTLTGETLNPVLDCKSELQLALEMGTETPWHRNWFVPGEIVLRQTPDGRSMFFERATIRLESRFIQFQRNGTMVDVSGSSPVTDEFTRCLTDHYSEFAAQKPELAELVQLAKIVGLVKWLRDNNIPVDLSRIANYQVKHVDTPTETPGVVAQKSARKGRATVTVISMGGVSFDTENTYLPDSQGQAADLGRQALASRPAIKPLAWEFEQGGETYTALAFPPPDGPTIATFGPGNSLTVEYDNQANAIRYWDAARNTFSYQYDDQNHLISETDPLGQATTFQYDQDDRLVGVTDRKGKKVVFDYNQDGLLTEMISPLSDRIQLNYNSLGLPEAVADPLGRVTTFEYDDLNRLTQERSGLRLSGQSSNGRFSYNAVDPLIFAYEYDASGNLAALQDPAGSRTTFTYDAVGNLAGIQLPGGGEIKQTFADGGQLASVTDPLGYQVRFDYDPQGQLQSLTTPAGATTYQYEDGLLTAIVNPLGQIIEYEYNQADLLTTVTEPGRATTHYEYDQVGNLVAVVDARGGRTEYEYDGLGQLITIHTQNPATTGAVTSPAPKAKSQITSTPSQGAGGAPSSQPEKPPVSNWWRVVLRGGGGIIILALALVIGLVVVHKVMEAAYLRKAGK